MLRSMNAGPTPANCFGTARKISFHKLRQHLIDSIDEYMIGSMCIVVPCNNWLPTWYTIIKAFWFGPFDDLLELTHLAQSFLRMFSLDHTMAARSVCVAAMLFSSASHLELYFCCVAFKKISQIDLCIRCQNVMSDLSRFWTRTSIQNWSMRFLTRI